MTHPGAKAAAQAGGVHPLAGRTILQIIPELDAGGAERTTVDIAAGLAAVGARALVLTAGGRMVTELQAKGGVWVPFPATAKSPFKMALNIRSLARLCTAEQAAILHARSRAPAWVALGAARSLGIPFVTTYHGSYSGRYAPKVFYNSVMARGDAVIANSHYTADLIRSAHPRIRSPITVIPRGTDLTAFAPAAVEPGRIEALRRAWGVATHERIVLLAARLTGWKGQKVLIEAAAKLQQAGLTDVTFVLAGDPQGRTSYVRELDALIASHGLTGIVRRVGHCTDMPAAFLAASVLTVPSTEPEAFGRSAIEAQAMGTPVVVTDHGAVPETVLAPPDVPEQERTGWRIPPRDTAALARGIAAALTLDPAEREALKQRARAHVERHFSLEHMVSDTLDVYTSLLEGHRASKCTPYHRIASISPAPGTVPICKFAVSAGPQPTPTEVYPSPS